MSSRVPGSNPGRPHVGEPRNCEALGLIEYSRDDFFGCSLIVFGNPTKNVLKVVQCFIVEDNPHASRSRKRVRACASVTYFGFFFARRRRTSASCSLVSRSALLSCCSISSTTWATSACRFGGQVSTRSRISFT